MKLKPIVIVAPRQVGLCQDHGKRNNDIESPQFGERFLTQPA
jgi:hypothetical protein